MSLPAFEYLAPTSGDELAGVLATHGATARILAGGTDLLNWMGQRIYTPRYVVDLRRVPGLADITYEPGRGLTIGAATTIEALERSAVIGRHYPALQEAAGQIGSPQIRAMATIGGNACNASPCADMPPPLVVLGATVVLASVRGERELPLEEFIRGNRETALAPDEFMRCLRVPDPWPRSANRFRAFGLRAAQEIDIASVAVNLALDGSGAVDRARIALGAVAPVPMRATDAEGLLAGQPPSDQAIDRAAAACAAQCRPIDDLRASASYRRHVVGVLARDVLRQVRAAIG
jgi:carbon-monoxide dehydrogenase medium subunit